ncbi:MAG: hybrid sensor histidine kinase/response regulator, partial [Planctomycetes bacterium]|nr:hybrid sensor histidine kinase/response regulator [Planctomycetota bacterium]
MSTNENKIFRILAVDDEQGILDSYTKILSGQTNGSESADEAMRLANKLFAENDTSEQPQEHGSEITFELTCCKQGVEAIETVQAAVETQKPFSVVFIDMRMPPGIDGIKAAEVIRDLDPNIQIVIVTGFSDIAPQHIARQVPPVDKLLYIQKPFHHQEVVQFATALSVKWKQEKLLQEINEELEKRVDERTRELVELNKELKDHSNMRTEFVVNVAHELRTPLTIFKNILSNALAGVDGKIEPKLRRNLETAVQTIDRLARVSNDFFDLSKIDVGKLNLNIKRFAIQDIITDVVSSMGHLAKEQNANIAMLMPDEELFIDADHDRIAQVLINLITNAIKFVPENTGDITVHLVDA